MSVARCVFLAGFAVILAGLVAFSVVAVGRATRMSGLPAVLRQAITRLGRVRATPGEAGRLAFLAHRIGGVAVFGFLALHIVDVGLYAISPDLYDDVHGLFGTWPMRVFECGLLFAILFHTLNGLRLIVLDLTDAGPRVASGLLRVTGVATLVLGVAGSIVIMAPVFT